ncbi:hypothetical protein GCM10025787_11670 [Saccharopolyspora rosea]
MDPQQALGVVHSAGNLDEIADNSGCTGGILIVWVTKAPCDLTCGPLTLLRCDRRRTAVAPAEHSETWGRPPLAGASDITGDWGETRSVPSTDRTSR